MLKISKGPGDLDFLTWSSPDGEISPMQQVEQASRQIAEHLEATGAVLLHERYYGDLELADQLLERREKVRTDLGLKKGLPPTYVEGKSCFSSPLAGIHAISARPATAGATELIRWNGEISGCSVEGRDGMYLYLTDLARLVPEEHRVDPGLETKSTFDIAGAILESRGWTFGEVCRTWFYLGNILDWYDEFNDVRNRYFEGLGLFNSASKAMIPASTGILGSNVRRGWCTLDLLATRGTSSGPITTTS